MPSIVVVSGVCSCSAQKNKTDIIYISTMLCSKEFANAKLAVLLQACYFGSKRGQQNMQSN